MCRSGIPSRLPACCGFPTHLVGESLHKIKRKYGSIILCDRFSDSTIAYQVYGKGVDRKFVDHIHKFILGNINPDLTFILKVSISKALKRLKRRKKKNRYDKFSKNFYIKAQNAFIKIAKKNKKRYIILDNTKDSDAVEKIIFKKILTLLKND